MNKGPAINGAGKRKLLSWIDAFVQFTDNLESPVIWRKWAAISAIAAALERKVFVTTSSELYPNLYTFFVGDPGTGKTRAIMAAKGFIDELPEFHFAPTSVTMASLVDHMAEAKRTIINLPHTAIEYNTLMIMADELSAFMHEYSGDLVAGLTTFYDGVAYSQGRRVKDIRIKIKHPCLNILSGTTPSNLIKFIPEGAWEQGFTSRIIMIFSDDRPVIDVFNTPPKEKSKEMVHDLKLINSLHGEFGYSKEFAEAMHNWKILNYQPRPEHPKLSHYNSRRFAHLIKLAMVANVDRGNSLYIEKNDFNRAFGWLMEAEANMPAIFEAGAGGLDANAMDEIAHFVGKMGAEGMSEHLIIRYARDRVPANTVLNLIAIMERSGMIQAFAHDKAGVKKYRRPIQH